MKFSSINDGFFALCSFDTELLDNAHIGKRPYIIVLRLKYYNIRPYFALPFRSNISATTPRNQFFPLPPRKATKDKRHHGLHYIKMFPVKKEYLEKFNVDKDPYYAMIKGFIAKNGRRVIAEAQQYIDNYMSGTRCPYCTNIDAIFSTLYGAEAFEGLRQAAATKTED